VTKIGNTYAYINLFDKKKLANAKKVQDIAVEMPELKEATSVVDALNVLENREIGVAAVTKGRKLIGLVTAQHLEAFITLHALQKRKQTYG
jgi:CBS domain-containing protein